MRRWGTTKMSRKPGRMVYVPVNVLEEAEAIIGCGKAKKRAEALTKMAQYSRVGREAEAILRLDFTIVKPKKRQK